MMLSTSNNQLRRMKYTACVDYLIDNESLNLERIKLDSMLQLKL